jgi:hypothetical protein
LVRAISLVLLVTQATGCSSWRTQEAFPERVVARKSPERVRIQRIETPGSNTGRTIAVTLVSLAIVAGVAVIAAFGAAISVSD